MPPFIALVLCAALVLVLLYIEKRNSRGVSSAIWIPTIWMLIASSRPLVTWFVGSSRSTGGNEAGSPLDRWVLTGLGVLAIFVLAHRRFDFWGTLRAHKWLIALLAYMLISTVWSDITFIALKRWMREAIVLIMALVVVSEANPRQALASLLRRCAYVLIPFSLMLIKYYPVLGRQYARYSGVEMWTGVTGQKNELGRLCTISILFFLFSAYRRWRKGKVVEVETPFWTDAFLLFMTVYLLIGANSSTSLATLILGIMIFLCLLILRKLHFRVPKLGLTLLVILLITYGTVTPFLGGSNVAIFSSSLGRDETVTGRTEVWAAVLPAMSQHQIAGHGFGSFWTDARRELYEIPTAHNGYLDIMLELGAIGLGFYTIWLISSAHKLHGALAD